MSTMNKIILVLCLVFAFAKEDIDSGAGICLPKNLVVHKDEFLRLNEVQYLKIMQNYESRLEHFKERYLGSVAEVDVQNDLLVASIAKNGELLNPSKFLNDSIKHYCISKYSASIPTEIYTTTSVTHCSIEARIQVTSLLSSLNSTRNALRHFYKNNFQKHSKNCGESYHKTTANYSLCITAVASNFNTYAFSNQKLFNSQLEDANYTAAKYIKKAVDCYYTVQTRAITLIAEANLLIDKCLEGKDDWKLCDEENACPDSYNLHVDYEKETISNPFNEYRNHTGCLVFNVKNSR